MEILKKAQSKINEILLPLEFDLKFEDYDIKNFQVQNYLVKSDPYLLSKDGKIKILLRYPFYFQSGEKACVVICEENFKEFDVNDTFIIKKIRVTDLQTLEINCDNATFLALPGVYLGWGIYVVNNKPLIQHCGIEEGIYF